MSAQLAQSYERKINLGQTKPDNTSALMHVQVAQTTESLLNDGLITQNEARKMLGLDICDPAYLPDWRRHDDPRSARKYKCPYCDVWSDNDIGVCEHCGAPKE